MPFGVSPKGNDCLPSGATTSATTKFQVPTIWSRRLFCCAVAGDATSIKAKRPPIPIFMSSPEVLRGNAPRQEYFGSRSRSSIEMPCGPRRKQIFMPGRGMRPLGELDALFPEVGRDCVDARDRKAEM